MLFSILFSQPVFYDFLCRDFPSWVVDHSVSCRGMLILDVMISELSSECHDPVGYGFFRESLLSRQVLQVKTDPNGNREPGSFSEDVLGI
jgi:hypothetical protein